MSMQHVTTQKGLTSAHVIQDTVAMDILAMVQDMIFLMLYE